MLGRRRKSIYVALAAALGVTGAIAGLQPVGADEGDAETTVVATGLNNPRGLAWGPDNALYVAEAGKGGSGPCLSGPEGEACVGLTGSVTRVWRGEQERVVKGLPSLADPTGAAAIGPSDVSLRKHRAIYISVGNLGGPEERAHFGRKGRALGHLVRATPNGDWELVADLAEYEAEANPDEGVIDSNPNAVLKKGGRALVVDAAGNSVLKVDGDGDISTVAVFPNRTVTFNGEQVPMQAVPTSIVEGPDGALYVGQLTGFPFPVGKARVYRIEPGEKPEIYARGFTNIIDIAFDDDGDLFVLEIAHNGLLAEEPFGALIEVGSDGSRSIVLNKLNFPGGLAFDDRGRAYVSNCGVCPGDGEVLRLDP
ncbi:MAG TPA: ScyD/ScyE family protein [Actinomycetota bacterium]|nr:ScyD/ScyE family protein [Actinomycetota bacterium]